MSTAAEKAQTAFAAISARRFRKEVTREEYNEEVSRISSEFAHDLWAEHLPILPLEAADHVYDRLERRALVWLLRGREPLHGPRGHGREDAPGDQGGGEVKGGEVRRGARVRTLDGEVGEVSGWCDDDQDLVEFWLFSPQGEALGMAAAYPKDLELVED